MARKGTETDPKTGLAAVVGIVGTLVLILIIVGLQALFYHVEGDIYTEIYAEPNLDVKMVRAQQLETLNSYGWVDRQKGVVRIPIDRAMELVVADPNAAPAVAPAAPAMPAPATPAPAAAAATPAPAPGGAAGTP